MENYSIKILKRELETLMISKNGFEKQKEKRVGEELRYVTNQLSIINENIIDIGKAITILEGV
jgi:hypothetical protein